VTKSIRTPLIRAAVALGAALLGGTALAGGLRLAGDGSGTNNIDLLADPATHCENCQSRAPHEWDAPPFTVDWSLALRGAYVRSSSSGTSYEALAVPTFKLEHTFLRGKYSLDGSAELSRSTREEFRINALRLGAAGEFQVNEALSLSGSAKFAALTPSASSTGYPTSTVSASRELSGDATGAAAYDFGRLTATLRGSLGRSVYGQTTLANGTQIDNSANDNWRIGGGLRIGYKVTPILTAFVDGGVGYQAYDVVAPSYGVKLDATDLTLRGGISAKFNQVLEGEVSAGLGYRKFAFAAADDFVSQLYDASLTFRPDETLTLRGGLATTVGAPGPNASGAAKVEYAATGDIGYQVNPWVKLRASAGYRYAVFSDSTTLETGYSLGAGTDYLVNENLSLTADYAYSATTSATPVDEEHRVTLGATLKR
jgi:hypothetical protein